MILLLSIVWFNLSVLINLTKPTIWSGSIKLNPSWYVLIYMNFVMVVPIYHPELYHLLLMLLCPLPIVPIRNGSDLIIWLEPSYKLLLLLNLLLATRLLRKYGLPSSHLQSWIQKTRDSTQRWASIPSSRWSICGW